MGKCMEPGCNKSTDKACYQAGLVGSGNRCREHLDAYYRTTFGYGVDEALKRKQQNSKSGAHYCHYCGHKATHRDFYGAWVCDDCR